ncbi:MFS transporter [Paenibacillus chitinolyticus]|uniref:MFS transporter n=1 Tax=Paenibacillus chitinolyticus TaxID=79263 RepID=A0A410WXT4_9BACL|nr:MFS transporter [Paenibacillus chitinolyticus]MCY9589895.1 MFS transporter [Paenibacillus chitinolyticus]MCY9596232.1 MFS transporter [Paenibacillus chitinolyticus]QAV19266.1 MFS transporter [Paenibacillus chitinolyticus]
MKPAIKENPFNQSAIWLYIVAFVFYATNHMLIIALPFLSQSLGAGRSEIGIIMGAYMFVSMFLRPVAGAVVDRFGTRNIFMIALVLNVIVLISYTAENLWAFAIMRALQGAILAFFSMTIHLLVMDLLSDKVRGQGLSLLSLASMLPYTFVPALVLFLKNQVSMTELLLLFAGLGFCNIFLGGRLFRSLSNNTGKQEKKEMEPVSIEAKAKAGRALIFPSLVMLLASIIFCIAPTYMPLYLESQGLSTAPLYFLTETGVLIFIRFFGRKYIPSSDSFPKGLLVALVICFTLSPALLALSLSTPVLLIAAVCNGMALSLLYPTLMTYISFVVPEKVRGYSIGWFIAAADFGTSSGAFLMGWLADAFTYRGMFVAAVGIGVFTLVLTFWHKGQKAVSS